MISDFSNVKKSTKTKLKYILESLMKVNKKNYSSIWEEDGVIKIIDQTKLPFKFEVLSLKFKRFFRCY